MGQILPFPRARFQGVPPPARSRVAADPLIAKIRRLERLNPKWRIRLSRYLDELIAGEVVARALNQQGA